MLIIAGKTDPRTATLGARDCLKLARPRFHDHRPSARHAPSLAVVLPMNLKMAGLISNDLCVLRFMGAMRAKIPG
jgi:hypothetical protein